MRASSAFSEASSRRPFHRLSSRSPETCPDPPPREPPVELLVWKTAAGRASAVSSVEEKTDRERYRCRRDRVARKEILGVETGEKMRPGRG